MVTTKGILYHNVRGLSTSPFVDVVYNGTKLDSKRGAIRTLFIQHIGEAKHQGEQNSRANRRNQSRVMNKENNRSRTSW
jgi:hypothetical protein